MVPTVTVAAAVKPVPTMVRCVLPAVVPRAGVRPCAMTRSTTGAASPRYWKEPVEPAATVVDDTELAWPVTRTLRTRYRAPPSDDMTAGSTSRTRTYRARCPNGAAIVRSSCVIVVAVPRSKSTTVVHDSPSTDSSTVYASAKYSSSNSTATLRTTWVPAAVLLIAPPRMSTTSSTGDPSEPASGAERHDDMYWPSTRFDVGKPWP